MKKLILIILLICSAISFGQTRRYVNPNATGGVYNGLSWTTGWRTFSAINWGALSGGGYLYISGGTTSQTYNTQLLPSASGSWNNYIHILPGKYAPSPSGHDGRWIIDMQNQNASGVYIGDRNWIYLKGVEITGGLEPGVKVHNTSRHIVIDSLTITAIGDFGIFVNGAACMGEGQDMDNWDSTDVCLDVEIKNCTILSDEDRWCPPASQCGDDMIQVACSRNVNIHDNYIRNRNVQSASPPGQHVHMDDIQCFNTQGIKIWNNVCIIDSGVYGHNMIIDVQSRNGAWYSGVDECIVYNNFTYHGGHINANGYPYTQHIYLRWYNEAAAQAPTYILNNTFVKANGSGGFIECQRKGMWKNNIFYDYGTLGQDPANFGGQHNGFWWSDNVGTAFHIPIDSSQGNLFWRVWTTNHQPDFGGTAWSGNGTTGGTPTWTTWQSIYGGNGVNANPLFTTNFRLGYHDIASNSPAINAGRQTDWVKAFLQSRGLPITDFYGHTRTGVWDIGAMEYGAGGWTPPDTTATVTIDSVTGAELNSYHIGSGVLSGADSTFHIWTATADSFRVTGGSFNTTMVSAVSGNTLYIPVIASNQYSTSVTNYVVVSGTTRSFTVTTKADPGGGGTVNGGWLSGSNGRKIYLSNGHALITRQP